jgi:putative ATP-dependent endonuclease of OLD family
MPLFERREPMYISKIEIRNFRNFLDTSIEFNDGVNVLIGHNNSGKSNLLRALGLIFDRNAQKRLTVDDFCKEIKDFNEPPQIAVSATLKESVKKENEKPDDKRIVSTWLLNLESPYEAKLTYSFFLPESEIENYQKEMKKISNLNATPYDYWRLIKKKFIRKYIARIYGGTPEFSNPAESDLLDKFDYQFLEPMRDVERTMFLGRNPMLRDILDYFLDDDIKAGADLENSEKEQVIDKRENNFFKGSKEVIDSLKGRVNIDAILEYSEYTGASAGGIPKFEGEISEAELLSALKLIITNITGIDIPATHNGLGYNNLIFMALVLAKMQMDCSSYIGQENAKVFPMLIIEEPEAHLHPSMQFKFLKFLRENINKAKQVRQLFISTHSTHITAAVGLDEIICMYLDNTNRLNVAYPGKTFDLGRIEERKSKAFVERFLDATKSDMLFSNSVVFVEGIAEQILLHCFSEYEDKPLVDKHVSIINVGGRYFEHFLKLFNFDESNPYKKHAINKKVACIIDSDPTKLSEDHWVECYPFEAKENDEGYRCISNVAVSLKEGKASNIQIFFNGSGKGKTFEYDIAFENPNCGLLITDCMGKKHQETVKNLMERYAENGLESLKHIRNIDNKISALIEASGWSSEDDKRRALIAVHYLKAVEKVKGENALQLEYNLRANLDSGKPVPFKVPQNIRDAINWVYG